MKTRFLIGILWAIGGLISLAACATMNTAPPTATSAFPTLPPVLPTQPRIETPAANLAIIDSVQIRILESFPVQAQAIAKGNLPDSCTTIDAVRQTREGNAFKITLTTKRPANPMCAQVLTPFEQVIALAVNGLPKGKYDVIINHASASFELQSDNTLGAPTQTIVGEFVTFDVPQSWNPTKRSLAPGAMLEDWQLGIPGVTSDQALGFSAVAFNQLRPNDVISETPIIVGGKHGVKWIRQGTNYVSYDYYAPGRGEQGSFGVHVTLSHKNAEIERQLDQLVASIVFK